MHQLWRGYTTLYQTLRTRQNTSLPRLLPRHLSVRSTIVRPQVLSGSHVEFAVNGYKACAEARMIKEPEDAPRDEFMTGVNLPVLKYAAAQALSTTEEPSVVFKDQGGFNRLFLLEFPKLGKKLVARIPLKEGRNPCRVDVAVATISFVRHVRGIPAPRVYAWNASVDNPVGAPYILQEWFEDVVEPWSIWKDASDEQRAVVFDELARWHAALLDPLPAPLHGVGDLVFAPSLPHDADLSDPRSYLVRPLHRRVWRPIGACPDLAFQASSTSLPVVWDEILAQRFTLALASNYSKVYGAELGFDEDLNFVPCDVQSFNTVASHARTFVNTALSHLQSSNPAYSAPCFVRSDYAFRNILLDPTTYRVRAFIDWDDVHVIPAVLGFNFPEDILEHSLTGLDPNSTYFREGWFGDLPPDEYGVIVGPFDEHGESNYYDASGKSKNDLEYHDERIRNTMYREAYIQALQKYEGRATHEALWQLRKEMVKADTLVEYGASGWWRRRSWLASQIEGSQEV